MNTYRVFIGASAHIIDDVKIVRARNCAEAERKALKKSKKLHEEHRVVKVEELDGEFVE